MLKHAKGQSWEGWYRPQPGLWNGQRHWSNGNNARLFFYNLGQGGEIAWSFTKKETQQGKLNFNEGGWIPPIKDKTTGTWVPVPPSGSRKWVTSTEFDTLIELEVLQCGEMPNISK